VKIGLEMHFAKKPHLRQQSRIGMSQIQNTLLQQLDVKKNCYRWIPHKVTPDEKEQRIEWCRKTQKKFKGHTSNLIWNF
jgi:hypothetical protein